MNEGQRSIWFGAAFVVVIALVGATLWKVAKPNDEVARHLAALDSKLDAANAALEKVQTSTATAGIDEKLAQLSAKIDKTNAALAKAQTSTTSADVDARLGQLAGKLDATNAALAELQKGTLLKSVADKLEALNAGIKQTDTELADITKSIPQGGLDAKLSARFDALGNDLKSVSGTLDELKQSMSGQKLNGQIASVSGAIKSLNDSVAAVSGEIKGINDTVGKLQKASAGTGADKTAALSSAVGDMQKNIEAASSLGSKLGDQVSKLEQATKAAAAPKPSELVFVYLHLPDEKQMPQTVATVTPLTVQFVRIGSTDDKGQGQAIIAKLQDIIKGRKECSISVVGYADTLGGDAVNLEISKKRAAAVAQQLKQAFQGTGVQINEAAWGERRLKDWTPDNTPSLANRRVDVAVNCKG
jgi:outer membrane protein OmpA-like peptidoglycan-associated protein/cob(I)alamin adenosyltransferase